MKETPILFTPENVRKVLAGTKTQTRRIVKPQPEYLLKCDMNNVWRQITPQGEAVNLRTHRSPYGEPGDRLWVRETWRRVRPDGEFDWAIEYKADGSKMPWVDHEGWYTNEPDENPPWKPSIHMPRKFCRLWLELTAVRVERLQEISEEEAKAEGADDVWATGRRSHKIGFRQLWNSINGAGSWEANPWVWVLSLKRVQP